MVAAAMDSVAVEVATGAETGWGAEGTAEAVSEAPVDAAVAEKALAGSEALANAVAALEVDSAVGTMEVAVKGTDMMEVVVMVVPAAAVVRV